jgi:hypothetical protein
MTSAPTTGASLALDAAWSTVVSRAAEMDRRIRRRAAEICGNVATSVPGAAFAGALIQREPGQRR